ncbi:ComEC family competence protein [Corynebacterium occultum]|uniref:ComEC family competence protein n=1 Tax=Corynebacterium occultum TaxID=2675219 RepID=A0A6B8VR41_9CORY|nr:ComEC/Rec2 family competence protein [Corynebacterium occultum]QGU08022.1 ComEC family competence protein [Corynebacterium occultum]
MSELRLVPTALLLWALTLLALFTRGIWPSLGLVLLAVLIALILRHPGQALLLGSTGTVASGFVHTRLSAVAAAELGDTLKGRLVGSPAEVNPGTWILRIRVDDYPTPVPTLLKTTALPEEAVAGALVHLPVRLQDSERPGLGEVLALATEIEMAHPASGMSAFAAHVRECFSTAVMESVGPSSQGLLPGMVLGDTSLQTEVENQLYLDTGLSHLSAVSGSNVMIVTTTVILLCRWLTLGPRIQTCAAGGALLLFVCLVGTEPSVLRAAVTGVVGLLAVLNSARMEPIHALSLSVGALLLYDSDLAVSYGFALSVAATAGIVALSPLLARVLAPTRWPEILVRALAVAIAADVVTMPLIAMMSGRVSLVAVLANVLVSPAVAPVTLFGLLAAGLSLLPGGLEWWPLKVVEPCTWWIHHTAAWCAQLPSATIDTPDGWVGPVWVLLFCCWLIAAFLHHHPRKVLGGLLSCYLCAGVAGIQPSFFRSPEIPLAQLQQHVVDSEAGIAPVPVGTQVVIVQDGGGEPSLLPLYTGEGIPVLFPNRDGPVSLHQDGKQHAADGRF